MVTGSRQLLPPWGNLCCLSGSLRGVRRISWRVIPALKKSEGLRKERKEFRIFAKKGRVGRNSESEEERAWNAYVKWRARFYAGNGVPGLSSGFLFTRVVSTAVFRSISVLDRSGESVGVQLDFSELEARTWKGVFPRGKLTSARGSELCRYSWSIEEFPCV